MKILAIRLRNLASMEGVTEIDFTREPLCSAGIFAITGPTGAGKSTILDALCLALYAKTPRYTQGKEPGIEVNELNQGDVRGILRNGTGDGYAEVDFIGIDEKKYRARWAVKRARNKADGAIQKDTLTLTDLNSALVVTDMKMEACREIERLVGLSFEQFTRSVLLAQGDFTAFLKADNNDKASLLEKLTGTNIYSKISQQVFANYKATQSTIEQLRLVLENVAVMSADEIEAENQKQWDSMNQLAEIQKDLQHVEQEILWQERMIVLETQKKAAVLALESAQKQKQDASEDEAQLKLIEEAQKIRSTFELHQSLQEEFTADNRNLERARNELSAFQLDLTEIELSIALRSTQLNDAIEIRRNALPLLNEALSLDIQLTGQEKNFRSSENAWIEARKRTEEKEAELAKMKDNLQEVDKTIKSLNDWKQKNLDREPIAINIQFIRTRLEEASRLLKTASDISADLYKRKNEIEESEQVLTKLKENIICKESAVQSLRNEKDKLQLQLNEFNPAALENARTEIESVLHRMIPAQASWTILYDKRVSLSSIEKNISDLKAEAQDHQNRLNSIEELLPFAADKKNSSDQRLKRARLELSESVELLRNHLSDGEACPVCGSLEHPYTKHHPQVETLLNLLETEAKDDYERWAALLNEKQVIIESVNHLVIQVERLQVSSQETASLIEKHAHDWKSFQLDIGTVPESEITEWLECRIKKHQSSQQKLIQQINEYSAIETELRKKQSSYTDHEKEYNTELNRFSIESGKVQLLNQRLNEVEIDLQNKETELCDLTNALNIYFNQPSWYSNWKQAPRDFVNKLDGFEIEWKENLAALETHLRTRELIEHSIAQITVQYTEFKTFAENQLKLYENAKIIYQDLQLRRKKIFDGRSIPEVESEHQENMEQANMEVEKEKAAKEIILQKIAVANSVINQLLKSISNKQLTIDDLMQKVNHWLGKINKSAQHAVDIFHLKELLGYSHEWIEEQQRSIKSMDRLIIESEANLKERLREIEIHSSSGPSVRAVDVLYPERERIKSEKTKQDEFLLLSKFRINEDAANKKRAGKIINDIENASVLADNWSKLNEMIGSADGKKFRQVAQEYTLEVLLGFANQHLDALNKRYQLKRIENTLGLLVIDKDMGDEERTVVSLSGGESFLVSLALALGLASLSSTRIKVESLFIDEGFGSLDPGTLNIAMEALERLHNQGRKVGVISHVQEMQERISTQIKVVKQSTGKSAVVVEGLS